MTLSPPGTTEMREPGPLSHTDLAATVWGASQIRLVADRVASRRTGSTHKVYRGWRFAVVTDDGHPGAGRTLFTVPIDPAQLAASQARYALVQLPHQGLIAVGEASAFSWSTTSIGATDPFATALAGSASTTGARRLEAGCEARNSLRQTRSDPGRWERGGDAIR